MCYKYDSTNRTWTESLYSCNELSTPKIWSTLASVHDNETNEFLTNLTGGSEWTWVGGYLGDDDLWYWVDGSKWTGYNNWGPGQPDNLWGKDDHLGLNYPGTGHWNDFGEDYPQGSICQYDPYQSVDNNAFTCLPAGSQCSHAGVDMGGFEGFVCCEGTVCGYGQLPTTSEPFYCTAPYDPSETTAASAACTAAGALCSAGGPACCSGTCTAMGPTSYCMG